MAMTNFSHYVAKARNTGIRLAAVMAAMALAFPAIGAEETDSTNHKEYVEEIGYLQKAYSDAGDPRFMLTTKDNVLSVGFGARIQCNAFYDFSGALGSHQFAPSSISVPTDKTGHFDYTAAGTKLYAKARAQKGKFKVIAYIDFTCKENVEKNREDICLGKAYMSVNGLTIGKTYSYFMDLKAGPATVDLKGPNTQVSLTHTLIGYTYKFNPHWTLAAALEKPSKIVNDKTVEGIKQNYNKYPDVTFHLKYKGSHGHVQVAGLWENISYWLSHDGTGANAEEVSRRTSGYGIALSGEYKALPNLSFSAQGVYGKGVANYIQDLANSSLHLCSSGQIDKEGYVIFKSVPAFGAYVSATYSWTLSLMSNIIYGYCAIDRKDSYSYANDFAHSQYFAANLFYYITPYCFGGIEYNFGEKKIASGIKGHANRINLCAVYRF